MGGSTRVSGKEKTGSPNPSVAPFSGIREGRKRGKKKSTSREGNGKVDLYCCRRPIDELSSSGAADESRGRTGGGRTPLNKKSVLKNFSPGRAKWNYYDDIEPAGHPKDWWKEKSEAGPSLPSRKGDWNRGGIAQDPFERRVDQV